MNRILRVLLVLSVFPLLLTAQKNKGAGGYPNAIQPVGITRALSDELLWNLFMKIPDMQNGLKKLGFESPVIKK